jgi:hypothetical protein
VQEFHEKIEGVFKEYSRTKMTFFKEYSRTKMTFFKEYSIDESLLHFYVSVIGTF